MASFYLIALNMRMWSTWIHIEHWSAAQCISNFIWSDFLFATLIRIFLLLYIYLESRKKKETNKQTNPNLIPLLAKMYGEGIIYGILFLRRKTITLLLPKFSIVHSNGEMQWWRTWAKKRWWWIFSLSMYNSATQQQSARKFLIRIQVKEKKEMKKNINCSVVLISAM